MDQLLLLHARAAMFVEELEESEEDRMMRVPTESERP